MSIISFENGKRRKREEEDLHQSIHDSFQQAAENLRQNDTEENFNALLNTMFDQLQDLISNPAIEGMIDRGKEDQKRFYKRYKDIFSVTPMNVFERIHQYANVMLSLVPTMFNSVDWETQYSAYIDFGHFHLDLLDRLFGKLEEKYGKPEYPFEFKPMDASSLEAALKDCLTKIIGLCSQQDKDSNIMDILYQGLRLFELDELLTDLFGEEIKAREKNDIQS